MKVNEIKHLEAWYSENYQKKISGRWVTLQHLLPIIQNLSSNYKVDRIGSSFENRDIYNIRVGSGLTKIVIWTQMHGNESTGTKALFDFFNFLDHPGKLHRVRDQILSTCTISCIPLLNPDGADFYTRLNAQGIDLNRDFIDKKAPESAILQKIVKKFQPDFCFNMHDQRTIFSVGNENNPATISFLAPSEDEERNITKGRERTMDIIVSMNDLLQNFIPDQVGRYTDEFYPAATGDNFQKMGYNTILIESGHYKNDYKREITRQFTFFALLQGLYSTSFKSKQDARKAYFEIPDNEKKYMDIILKDVVYLGNKTDVGILFDEKLIEKEVHFVPKVDKIINLGSYNADKIIIKSNLVFMNRNTLDKYVKREI